MKRLPILLAITALALPAGAADSKAVTAQACNDAGYDSGAIDHFMTLFKAERSSSGAVDTDLLHSWAEQIKCYSARLASVVVRFKQQTGRRFTVEKTCAGGAAHEAYANGFAAGSSPGPTCTQ